MDSQLASIIRQMQAENARLRQDVSSLASTVAELNKRPRAVEDEINSIPGRRVVYTLSGNQDFTSTQDGTRGAAISMLVSQDGPFIMTHYPVIMWRPSLPSTATNLGRWRPISSWQLLDQEAAATGGVTSDYIDISYELVDGGSQRNLQNLIVTPGLLSSGHGLELLPVPTLFAPNTIVQAFITYHNILLGGSTATTTGTLQIDLPGYRIANL